MNGIAFLQETTPSPAPEGEPQAPPGGLLSSPLFPLIIMAVLFYFLMWAPQRKKDKARNELLKSVKKNDHVLTQGGVYGVVHSLKDNEVTLIVDEKRDVRIRVARSAVVGVVKISGAAEGELAEPPREEARS